MKFKSVEKNFVIMEIRLDQLKLVFSYKILLKLFSLKKVHSGPLSWVGATVHSRPMILEVQRSKRSSVFCASLQLRPSALGGIMEAIRHETYYLDEGLHSVLVTSTTPSIILASLLFSQLALVVVPLLPTFQLLSSLYLWCDLSIASRRSLFSTFSLH